MSALTERLHLRLSTAQLDALRDAADERKTSMSDLVRGALVADGIIPPDGPIAVEVST